MRIKKFNENLSDDIFDDVDNLKYILTEFSDIGFNYDIKHTLFYTKPNGQLDWIGNLDVDNFSKYRGINEQVCAYLIQFEELFEDEVATINSFNGNHYLGRLGFSILDDRYFLFQEKIKYIKGVIERMGYVFSMSIRQSGYFEFLILEKK